MLDRVGVEHLGCSWALHAEKIRTSEGIAFISVIITPVVFAEILETSPSSCCLDVLS